MSRLWPWGRKKIAAGALYAVLVAQARSPDFYAQYGVADTLDGRFDMIALHVFLALHRLRGGDAETAVLAQALHDIMFDDMDRSLREMGVGDMGVGRRVRAMAEALYGRSAAYEEGLAADDAKLAEALRRNLYRDTNPSPDTLTGLCGYMRETVAVLAALSPAQLAAGAVSFPRIAPLPAARVAS